METKQMRHSSIPVAAGCGEPPPAGNLLETVQNQAQRFLKAAGDAITQGLAKAESEHWLSSGRQSGGQ